MNRELYKEMVLKPILEDYWTKVCEKREDERTWTTAAPFQDIFKPYAIPGTKSKIGDKEQVDVTMICVIPNKACFFDAVLAMYMIHAPDTYVSHQSMCKAILHSIQIIRLNPEGYHNFGEEAIDYFLRGALGMSTNGFLDDPQACIYKMLDVFAQVGGKDETFWKKTKDHIKNLFDRINKKCPPPSTEQQESSDTPSSTS